MEDHLTGHRRDILHPFFVFMLRDGQWDWDSIRFVFRDLKDSPGILSSGRRTFRLDDPSNAHP